MKRVAFLVFLGLVLQIVYSGRAHACMGPSLGDHHFPSCEIQGPSDLESVSVVFARGPYASTHVGDPSSATIFATVEIAPSEKKHYLVLQSGQQVIWNIKGDTDSVSRAVVLGASSIGPWAAGVVGLSKDRVFFTSPDLSALDDTLRTSCTSIAKSCVAAQWFGPTPSGRVYFHPSIGRERYRVDAYVEPQFSDHESLKGAMSPAGDRMREWPVSMPYLKYATEQVVVDPSTVIAPRGAAYYEQRTGQAGLDDLVESGALIAAGDPEHKRAVGAYAEAFSSRYRTRFDPGYLFVPQVDYVVTRKIKLPSDIRAHVFLLESGVPLPDMNGNDGYGICFLAMDRVEVPANRVDSKIPYCRENSLEMREPDNTVFQSVFWADTLKSGSNCSQAVLSSETEIVVLNVIEAGRIWQNGDPLREISVDVTAERPVVLYLDGSGGPAEWNISGTGVKDIYMLGDYSERSVNKINMNGESHSWKRLGLDKDDCPFFAPYEMELRGPSYLHLDRMMQTLLGRPIGRLLEIQAGAEGRVQITVE